MHQVRGKLYRRPLQMELGYDPDCLGLARYVELGGSDMHFILFYDVADDYLERRAGFRAAHLQMARQAYERGELVLAGALADPVDGAVLVFRGTSSDAAERFAMADPYVLNGLVKQWRVRQWTTVIGDGASVPAAK